MCDWKIMKLIKYMINVWLFNFNLDDNQILIQIKLTLKLKVTMMAQIFFPLENCNIGSNMTFLRSTCRQLSSGANPAARVS